jgi:hypothetical protein
MAAPVINTTTSILGYRQWEYFEYQPYATNTPTSWACPLLPAGLSIDEDTGLISGAASQPGVYVLGLTATNGDGTSAPMVLTIGIEAGAIQPTSGVDLFIDVVTGKVTMTLTGTTSEAALLSVKEDDDLLLYVRFVKAGQILDLDLDELTLFVKELEPDALVATSLAWEKSGSGANSVYLVHAKFDGSLLAGALSNYEEDDGTKFVGLAEIERVETSAWEGGPETLRVTSRTFGIEIERDLGQSA